jgi:hypothetical protein
MSDQHPTSIPTPRDFSLRPSPTPGYQPPGNPAPTPAPPGFTPRAGECQAAARTRVIDQVLEVVTSNGGRPSRNG